MLSQKSSSGKKSCQALLPSFGVSVKNQEQVLISDRSLKKVICKVLFSTNEI